MKGRVIAYFSFICFQSSDLEQLIRNSIAAWKNRVSLAVSKDVTIKDKTTFADCISIGRDTRQRDV